MPDSPRAKRTRILLIAFLVLLPAALWLGREYLSGWLIAGMPAMNAADLVVLTPIYIAFLLTLWNTMQKYGAPRWLGASFLVLSMAFIYGQGMHTTGNAIDTFATEVSDYREILPKDLYSLSFFLDGRLSYLVLFAAVVGLVGCWYAWNQGALAPPLLPELPLILIPIGLLYGVTMAYAVLEAGMVWIIIPIVLLLMWMWLWFWRRSGRSLGGYAGHRPFTIFVAVMTLVAVAVLIGWGLYFGGFPQPSEVGL